MVGRLMYLVDTNVWLELPLEQKRAKETRLFFQNVNADLLSITEFSLYSIGIILIKLNKYDIFKEFISDNFEDSGVIKVRLETVDLKRFSLSVRNFTLISMTPISI